MARVRTEKKYNTFVKGLVTEANPLTYPENASLDEDNFVLKRDGSRERRLGADFETGYALIDTGYLASDLSAGKQSFHKWESPAGDSSVSIGVVRVGAKLWFLDLLTGVPSRNLLNGGTPITIPQLGNYEMSAAVVNNYLIIVSEGLLHPVALYYNRDSQTVGHENIPIQVRDTWGIADGLPPRERPTTLSAKHEYNLRNQGWQPSIQTICGQSSFAYSQSLSYAGVGLIQIAQMWQTIAATIAQTSPAIQCTKATLGVYPSNADIWTLGKEASSTGDFEKYNPSTMARNSVESITAGKGSFILHAFERGYARRTLLGNSTLPLDKEWGRITTIANYAGRVFYSGVESRVTDGDGNSPNFSNCIFFSQVVTDSSKLGLCYQEADPTSDRISDMVDTDGGVIQIPEATKIVKIIGTRSSLLVFAENGVWEVFGADAGFVATSYQTSKVGSNGCSGGNTVAEASGTIFAWTKAGIYAYTVEPTTGRYKAESVSLTSVQTLYNSLPEYAKKYAIAFYDEKENTLRWLYNDTEGYSSLSNVNSYNRELVYDLTLGAFYSQSVDVTLGPYIAGYVDIPNYTVTSYEEAAYVGTEEVIDSALDSVVVDNDVAVTRASQFSFLVISDTSFTIGKYHNRGFRDWESYDSSGVDYLSYLLTGHETFGSIGSKKQIPYIWMHFLRTEDGFSEVGGQIVLNNPSGCLVQAQWDWADSANSGKWSNEFQGYKLLRPYFPSSQADTFDYGQTVIATKNRLRGSGRALSLLITSESGKDMKLLGWSLLIEVGR
jgi:hypothetical protein